VHAGLQARLYASAEDAKDLVAAAEFARGEGGDGSRAHVGEIAGIGQKGHGFAGFRRGEEHHAVAGGQAAREVAGKGGGDLEGEILSAAAIARFDVDFGVNGGDGEVHGHRHVALAAGVGDDGVAHAGDDVREREGAPDFRKFENPHQGKTSRRGGGCAQSV
jgi:hypothetical protein